MSSIGFFSDLQVSLSLKSLMNNIGSSNIFYNCKKYN